jgi:hypothetical protein
MLYKKDKKGLFYCLHHNKKFMFGDDSKIELVPIKEVDNYGTLWIRESFYKGSESRETTSCNAGTSGSEEKYLYGQNVRSRFFKTTVSKAVESPKERRLDNY